MAGLNGNKTNSASVEVEVEVEAELGKKNVSKIDLKRGKKPRFFFFISLEPQLFRKY